MEQTFFNQAIRGWHQQLPAHARIIANDEVWLESDAVEQLARAAQKPDCCLAVGMPDMHPGPNSPIGVVLGYRNTIVPALIGGDAGCGARLMITDGRRFSVEHVERRLARGEGQEWREDIDPMQLLAAVWRHGVAGIAGVQGVPEKLAQLARADDNAVSAALAPSSPLPTWCEAADGSALGTIGGGNHFLELTRVAGLHNIHRAHALGLERGAVAVLAHTGSRALGKRFAEVWHTHSLSDFEGHHRFLTELAGVLRYAAANRFLCTYEGLMALGEIRPTKIACTIDLCHNDVRREVIADQALWIHRKGAAPAHADTPSLLLGSRGAASWILWGMGSTASACSIAHGAGRRMNRGEARDKMRHKYTRSQMQRTAFGGRVLYDDNNLLFEEHPDAYKPVEPIVASLEQAGAALRVAHLHPLITIKR